MPDNAARCPVCFLKRAACLCASIPRVETRTRFVILRHVREARKPSNTGRLAGLALPRCTLLDYGAAGAPADLARLGAGATWLLFPEGPAAAPGAPPPAQVVVLDGTWPQARRMAQRIRALRGMPRLVLHAPAGPPASRLRCGRYPGELATLEAIAGAVAALEGDAAARPLGELFRLFVERSGPRRRDYALALDPLRGSAKVTGR